MAKRGRSTSGTGGRLSENISYVLSLSSSRFLAFPYTRKHLPGRFCCALYIELWYAKGITGPIDSGNWNLHARGYHLRLVFTCQ